MLIENTANQKKTMNEEYYAEDIFIWFFWPLSWQTTSSRKKQQHHEKKLNVLSESKVYKKRGGVRPGGIRIIQKLRCAGDEIFRF